MMWTRQGPRGFRGWRSAAYQLRQERRARVLHRTARRRAWACLLLLLGALACDPAGAGPADLAPPDPDLRTCPPPAPGCSCPEGYRCILGAGGPVCLACPSPSLGFHRTSAADREGAGRLFDAAPQCMGAKEGQCLLAACHRSRRLAAYADLAHDLAPLGDRRTGKEPYLAGFDGHHQIDVVPVAVVNHVEHRARAYKKGGAHPAAGRGGIQDLQCRRWTIYHRDIKAIDPPLATTPLFREHLSPECDVRRRHRTGVAKGVHVQPGSHGHPPFSGGGVRYGLCAWINVGTNGNRDGQSSHEQQVSDLHWRSVRPTARSDQACTAEQCCNFNRSVKFHHRVPGRLYHRPPPVYREGDYERTQATTQEIETRARRSRGATALRTGKEGARKAGRAKEGLLQSLPVAGHPGVAARASGWPRGCRRACLTPRDGARHQAQVPSLIPQPIFFHCIVNCSELACSHAGTSPANHRPGDRPGGGAS